MTLIIYYLIIAFVVFLDLFTKFLVKNSEVLMSGGTIEIIPNVFRLNYIENSGAAMGSFSESRWVFMLFSTVAIIGILIFLALKYKTVDKLLAVSLSLIVGGGIGNMYERIFNVNEAGEKVVTDFFDFYPFPELWRWIFNVADIAVCVGAALVVLYFIIDTVKEYKLSKLAPSGDELLAFDRPELDYEDMEELIGLDIGAYSETIDVDDTSGVGTSEETDEVEETDKIGDDDIDETDETDEAEETEETEETDKTDSSDKTDGADGENGN